MRRPVVIRFSCPQCGKKLKVPEERAGASVLCPRCGEMSVAPAAAAAGTGETVRQSPTQYPEQVPGLLRGMSSRERWAVILVAGAGVGGLLLPALSPLLPFPQVIASAAGWAVPLVVCSTVLLLAILYGHATGCPACGKWWSRAEVENGFVGRETFDRGDVSFSRSLFRTTYQCNACGHRWSVTNADEYPESPRDLPPRHRG